MTKKQKRKQTHRRQARRYRKPAVRALPAIPKKAGKRKLQAKGQKPSALALFLNRIRRNWFPEQKPCRHRIPWMWDAPFTCWSNGHCVRVWVGEKVLHMKGNFHGRTFQVPVQNLHHWGIGSGPWLSRREKTELVQLIQEKTAESPFLRVIFV